MKRLLILLALALPLAAQTPDPQPKVVTAGAAPSDAVVLFDGKDTSAWVYRDGRPAQWPVIDGILTCKSGTGNIYSKLGVSNRTQAAARGRELGLLD